MKDRSVRKIVALAVVAGFFGGISSSALLSAKPAWAEPKTFEMVSARCFHLVNKEGKIRASLSTGDGMTQLTLRDANNKARAILGIRADNSVIFALSDDHGNQRVWLGLKEDGWPGLGLIDSSHQSRVSLGLAPNGHPCLILDDTNSASEAILGVLANGNAQLILRDKNGRVTHKAPAP